MATNTDRRAVRKLRLPHEPHLIRGRSDLRRVTWMVQPDERVGSRREGELERHAHERRLPPVPHRLRQLIDRPRHDFLHGRVATQQAPGYGPDQGDYQECDDMALNIPDLPPGPCNDGVTLTMVARCVEGVWELGWLSTTSTDNLSRIAAPLKCGCGDKTPTHVNDTLSHAIKQGWTPAAVMDLAKLLSGK